MRQFYGRLEVLLCFCRKTSMSIKFLVLRGGYLGLLRGGSANFIFMGAGVFLILTNHAMLAVLIDPYRTLSRLSRSSIMAWNILRFQWAPPDEASTALNCPLGLLMLPWALSGPLRLRVQSRSRTRLRIAPLSRFFRAFLKGFRHCSTTIARLSPPSSLKRGG